MYMCLTSTIIQPQLTNSVITFPLLNAVHLTDNETYLYFQVNANYIDHGVHVTTSVNVLTVQISASYLHWTNSNWSEPYLIPLNSAGIMICK